MDGHDATVQHRGTCVQFVGLRHRLVHHYEDTNWIVICAIIFDVLPEFLEEIRDL